MAASTKLEIWQKDLIDMSRMNNLLHFRSSGRGAGIQFQVQDVNQWFTWFQSHHPFPLKDIRSNLPPDELERALVRLRARARDDLNDRGINTLYLAFGILAWRETEYSEEVIRSPLLLVPVTLSRVGSLGTFSLQRFTEEDIEINPTLREKLNHDFRIQLPTFDELEHAFEQQPGPINKQSSNSGSLSLQWIFEQLRKRWPAHPQWVIESSVYLGRFSFQKLVMYQDLIHHQDEILAHPLLRALGGNRAAIPRAELIQPHQLDQIHPRDSLEILDADSSQQEAILAAKRGDSFVLQGPPGTGKSQTIANIIAESLGLGRKVLFVSEKMAALEVVQQRLQAASLGDFCLDLHNPKADKKLFIQEIQSALSDSGRYPNPSSQTDWDRDSDGLARTRHELNLYIREVHLPRFVLGQSAFTAIGKLAALEDIPDTDFDIPQIHTTNQAQLNSMRQALENLAESVDVLDQHQTHPWRDTLVQTYSLGLESSIRDHLSRFSQELAELQTLLTRIRDGLGEEQAECTFAWTRYAMECVDRILQSPRPPRHWLSGDELQRIRAAAQDAAARSTNYHTQYAVFNARYHRSLLQLDHKALLQVLTERAAPIARGLQAQESTPQDSSITRRQELDQHLRVVISLLSGVSQAASAVAEASYQQPPTTLEGITMLNHLALLLLNTPNPPEPWLHAHQFSQIRAVALDASEHYNTCVRLRSLLEPLYEPVYFELDLHALAQRFKEKYQSAFRWLRPQYHQDMKRLKSQLRTGIQRTNAQLEADLYQAVKLLDEEQRLQEQRLEHSGVLGYYFNGVQTDWNQISAAINWTANFHASFGIGTLSPEMLRIVTGPLQSRTMLHTRYQHFAEVWEQWGKEAEYLSHLLKWEGVLGHPIHLERVEMSDVAAALQQFHAALQAFWQTIDTLAVHRATNHTPEIGSQASYSWAEILEDLHRAAEIASFETWLHEHQQQLAAELGPSFTGANTDWAALFTMLDWTEEFLRFTPHQQLPEKMAQLLCREGDEAARTTMSELFNATKTCLEHIREELAYVEAQVLPKYALLPLGKTLEMVTPLTVKERVDFFLDQLPQLGRWLTCKQRIEQCNQQGLGGFITRMLYQHPFPRNIARIFERRFYVLWLDEVRRQSPTLSQFQGELHQKQIDLFRQLDERHQRLAQQRLRSQLLQRRSALLTIVGNRRNAVVSDALADLMKEAQKKRHPPIRQIVRRVAPALLEIKSCWMMSPLSVSQFLESGSQLFDLVIFDEASQVCPEDAIAAILRGKQLIVVGDSKQLPPTRFFSKTLADEEEEELPGGEEQLENERMESILDECVGAGLSQRSLRWHYRSRHESLIAFSNHHFYQNRLVTFPSSAAEHQAGVRFVYVAGAAYDRGGSRTNKQEAKRVAQLVFEHLRQKPKQSLGVVALSEAQQQAIRDAIEAGIRSQPELKAWEKELTEDNPAGFFVKNLESVQGDERDVIILSIGYGPDASGRVHQNFGPVNKAGGERRLNVAVTRARHQVIVAASMRASDLSGDLNSPGARTLRSYLAYAERGPAVLSDTALAITPSTAQEVHFDSPFEEAVYHALIAKGLQLDTQVGCSEYRIDLAVRHPQQPGTYVMGIECDGRTYHSSATARDRDRLRQRHLEQMGWTIHRIWSTDWLRNPDREVSKVLEKHHQLQKHPDLQKEPPEKISPAPPPVSQTKPSVSHEEKPTQEFFASDTVWHPVFGYGTVVRGTIAFQDNAVEVEFSKSVGRKFIDLRETLLEKVKLDKQSPQTKPGSTQAPTQANRISQTTPPQTPASNPSSTPVQKPQLKFSTNDAVKHPFYGIGKVVSGGNTVIEVDFGGHGKKTLFPENTPLEKVHTGAVPSSSTPRQDTPPQKALSLSAFLRDKGLTVIDKRPIGGALWVVGGRELSPMMEDLQKKGIKFVFAPNGSRSTGNKPAWFFQ